MTTLDQWPALVAKELAKPEVVALITSARGELGKSDFPGRISIAIAARNLELIASGDIEVVEQEPHKGDPNWHLYITPRTIKALVKGLRESAILLDGP